MTKPAKEINKNMKSTIKSIMIPTAEEVEIRNKESYSESLLDPNNFNNWFYATSKSLNSDLIKVPSSQSFNFSFEWYKWLKSDDYTEEKIEEFTDYILSSLTLEKDKTYFIKTGNFSNKFNFEDCKLENINDIGSKFLSIFYASMLMGAIPQPTIVVREFIESSSPYEIYNGMPLRHEFRYFYNFDEGKMLGVSKYWHEKEMMKLVDYRATKMSREKAMHAREIYKTIKPHMVSSIDDYLVYDEFKDDYDKKYDKYKKLIGDVLSDNLIRGALNGKWSIDIMIEGQDLYLIDMAKMENSALVQYMEELD